MGTFLDVVRRPAAVFAEQAARPRPASGRNAIVILSVVWAALCLLLFAGGFRPTRGVAFIPHAQHYLWQAALLPSLLVFGWLVGAGVADRISRALGGRPALAALRATLGLAWAVPLTLLFVVPDLLVVILRGHGALASAMWWYVPPALVWAGVLGVMAVTRVTGLEAARALIVVLAAYAAQGVVTALIVR